MFDISLSLDSVQGESLNLALYPKRQKFDFDNIEKTLSRKVYSDKKYTLKISGDYTSILTIRLLLNDYEVRTKFNSDNGTIELLDSQRLFLEFYAFVFFEVIVEMEDGLESHYFSDYLNVMIRNGVDSESLKSMASYVYESQAYLLFDDNMKVLDSTSIHETERNTLESQIEITKKVVEVYTQCLPYFKTNAKFKLIDKTTVDNSEKLSVIGGDTLEYIVNHPEYLIESERNIGFKHQNNYYYPIKTLIHGQSKNYDIYENQIIISFLKKVVEESEMLLKSLSDKIEKFDKINQPEGDYQISAYLLYRTTEQRLKVLKEQLMSALYDLYDLYHIYRECLSVSEVPLLSMPKLTHTFQTLKYYNRVYYMIKVWFHFGIYDFSKEEFLAPFLINNQLYECYVLVKLINYYLDNSYSLENKMRYEYKCPDKRYVGTRYNNTFYFKKNNSELVIYYQPMLYKSIVPTNNGIDLIRNTRITFNSYSETRGSYYLPDYIIKYSSNEKDEYIILDAKYSKRSVVKSNYFPPLVYKYLFSVSSTKVSSVIRGLCAVNGKVEGDKELESIYYSHLEDDLFPRADIMTLSAENQGTDLDTHHNKLIQNFLSKYNY